MKKRIEVELTEQECVCINAIIDGSKDEEYCSSEKLNWNKLVQMLLKDVALTITRPGSWEGAKMLDLLESHGYDNTVFKEDWTKASRTLS